MAMITFCTPGPSVATTASAMMMSGKARKTSTTRWTIRSNNPPK